MGVAAQRDLQAGVGSEEHHESGTEPSVSAESSGGVWMQAEGEGFPGAAHLTYFDFTESQNIRD